MFLEQTPFGDLPLTLSVMSLAQASLRLFLATDINKDYELEGRNDRIDILKNYS